MTSGRRVYVLGAGASKEAGAPLTVELVPRVIAMLEGDYPVHNLSDLLSDAALVASSRRSLRTRVGPTSPAWMP